MRLKEFQKEMKKRKIDYSIFLNTDSEKANPNMFYFSEYRGIGALIVPKDKNPFLIVPEMEYGRIKGCKAYKSKKGKRLFELLNKLIKKNRIKNKKIGIDKGSLTLNEFKAIKKGLKKKKFADVSGLCLETRKIKTEKEIKIIKKACSITDSILKDCFKNFRKFKTETDVAAFLEFEAKKLGCGIAFKPVVASGKGSSVPHHEPKNIRLKKGFCVIDFGVKYQGYCADITRTIYIGKPNKNELKMYKLLHDIQVKAIEKIKIGKKCSDIVKFVYNSLGEYKKNFTHGLGHGIGAEIHEFPNLRELSSDKFEKNTLFTMEPGIYFNGKFGIRIEDDILMKDRPIVLTKIPKHLLIIK